MILHRPCVTCWGGVSICDSWMVCLLWSAGWFQSGLLCRGCIQFSLTTFATRQRWEQTALPVRLVSDFSIWKKYKVLVFVPAYSGSLYWGKSQQLLLINEAASPMSCVYRRGRQPMRTMANILQANTCGFCLECCVEKDAVAMQECHFQVSTFALGDKKGKWQRSSRYLILETRINTLLEQREKEDTCKMIPKILPPIFLILSNYGTKLKAGSNTKGHIQIPCSFYSQAQLSVGLEEFKE